MRTAVSRIRLRVLGQIIGEVGLPESSGTSRRAPGSSAQWPPRSLLFHLLTTRALPDASYHQRHSGKDPAAGGRSNDGNGTYGAAHSG